nr:enzymatic polyprotein [Tanacetum cinerariifolium]
MKREEDIEKILQNSSHEKQKWYVIFNGPFRGIYNDRAIANTHIIGKSVTHKSYLKKEAAEKALGESYKTVTTEEVQKSQQERKLIVPSLTIAQLGVNNQDYPSKDVNMEPTTPTLDDLTLSLFRVFSGSSKIGSGPGRTDKVRINYYSKNLLIYSYFQEKINEVQIKALVYFEDQFETFSGLLAPLPEDLKQLLCGYLSRTPRQHSKRFNRKNSISLPSHRLKQTQIKTHTTIRLHADDLTYARAKMATVIDLFVMGLRVFLLAYVVCVLMWFWVEPTYITMFPLYLLKTFQGHPMVTSWA